MQRNPTVIENTSSTSPVEEEKNARFCSRIISCSGRIQVGEISGWMQVAYSSVRIEVLEQMSQS